MDGSALGVPARPLREDGASAEGPPQSHATAPGLSGTTQLLAGPGRYAGAPGRRRRGLGADRPPQAARGAAMTDQAMIQATSSPCFSQGRWLNCASSIRCGTAPSVATLIIAGLYPGGQPLERQSPCSLRHAQPVHPGPPGQVGQSPPASRQNHENEPDIVQRVWLPLTLIRSGPQGLVAPTPNMPGHSKGRLHAWRGCGAGDGPTQSWPIVAVAAMGSTALTYPITTPAAHSSKRAWRCWRCIFLMMWSSWTSASLMLPASGRCTARWPARVTITPTGRTAWHSCSTSQPRASVSPGSS